MHTLHAPPLTCPSPLHAPPLFPLPYPSPPSLRPPLSFSSTLQALMGISIVIDAIKRFAPTENTLTAIHSDLIQVNNNY